MTLIQLLFFFAATGLNLALPMGGSSIDGAHQHDKGTGSQDSALVTNHHLPPFQWSDFDDLEPLPDLTRNDLHIIYGNSASHLHQPTYRGSEGSIDSNVATAQRKYHNSHGVEQLVQTNEIASTGKRGRPSVELDPNAHDYEVKRAQQEYNAIAYQRKKMAKTAKPERDLIQKGTSNYVQQTSSQQIGLPGRQRNNLKFLEGHHESIGHLNSEVERQSIYKMRLSKMNEEKGKIYKKSISDYQKQHRAKMSVEQRQARDKLYNDRKAAKRLLNPIESQKKYNEMKRKRQQSYRDQQKAKAASENDEFVQAHLLGMGERKVRKLGD